MLRIRSGRSPTPSSNPRAHRARLAPARHAAAQEHGMTLVEVLIAAILTTLVAGVAFVFLQGVSHSTAREEARNVSLVQQVSALQRMTEELSQAYQLNSPTTVGTTNLVDVNAWLATSAGAQTDRRLVYDCEIASSISGERQCERYEMPAT